MGKQKYYNIPIDFILRSKMMKYFYIFEQKNNHSPPRSWKSGRNEAFTRTFCIDCLFWICYPKLSGNIHSNLTRNAIWEIEGSIGMQCVSQITETTLPRTTRNVNISAGFRN